MGKAATVAVCERDLGRRHLALTAVAAQLYAGLHDREHTEHCGMHEGEAASAIDSPNSWSVMTTALLLSMNNVCSMQHARATPDHLKRDIDNDGQSQPTSQGLRP